MLIRLTVATLFVLTLAAGSQAQQPAITVPPGYTVELVAGPPLVEHPVMAAFDERGRLFVAENAGVNLQRTLLEEQLPNAILRLTDTDGDGRFDQRTVFADKLTFPQGALWHDGWLYSAVSGAIWRFQDQDDDGVAERREKIVSSFGYTGNAADIHGCFLGPEGRIYWCEGRHGHDITDAGGTTISKGKAARIFSCRADGSDVRTHCGGGMDNPVEIDWTAEGEMLGTVNILHSNRGDCLVHWMHGGVYPRADQHAALAEFRRTGDLLGPVHDYGHVAVSGCCRVRSILPLPLGEGRGEGVKNPTQADPHPLPNGEGTAPATTFLVTEFNTHRVVRTDLFRDGSTFRAAASEFLKSASGDFHPTDVLEDADGSFLVVDTGGWFRIGCPTSQEAKPNVLGAIYRVRRTDAKKIDDPRGLMIDWDELDSAALMKLLADERPAVRERAIATLTRQGNAAVSQLNRAAVDKDARVRQHALWTLARIGTPEAAGSIRLLGLADKDPAVLSVAIHGAGICRDAAAATDLAVLMLTNSPRFVLRDAATALGQIGDPGAVPLLFDGITQSGDRVLEHALIYALIEIHDRSETAKCLTSTDPRIRRAALIALDQMPGGDLTRDEVAALLDTADQPLQAAALDVISRHPGWTDELLALATKLLAQRDLTDQEQVLLSGALVAFVKNERVQAVVGQSLAAEGFHSRKLSLLLGVIAQCDLRPWPDAWTSAIRSALVNLAWDTPHLMQAAHALETSGESALDADLIRIGQNRTYPNELRIAALGAVAARLPKVEAADFDFLRTMLDGKLPAERRLAAARVLSAMPLSDAQLLVLAEDVAVAGPLEIRQLLAAYRRTKEVLVGRALFAALIKSKMGGGTITFAEADSLRQEFVPQLQMSAAELSGGWGSMTGLKADISKILLEKRLDTSGDKENGRAVFLGRKAACSTCHRVGSEGGRIGPDLSKVGERRTPLALLEAIVLPSNSLVRGFESQAIRTHDGQVLTGLIVRETPESVFLRTIDQRELRLKRSDIETQQASTISLMPAGLENTISQQEMADLLAFLASLK